MSLANSSNDTPPSREEIYQAFLRSLKRRRGFGIVFMQCPPAEAKRIIGRVHQDLPQKQIATLTLTEPIDNLYDRVKNILDRDQLSILFIQGLEKSLEAYIKPGYRGDGDYYNLDTVPTILSHLNQRRELFRDNFPTLCFVFVLPAFAIKYFIRRAPDFFDWGAGVFNFSVDIGANDFSDNVIQPGQNNINIGSGRPVGEEIDYFQQALQRQREIGDRVAWPTANRKGEADCLSSLGNAYRSLGQYREAINYLQQGLQIQHEIGDRYGELASLSSLGGALYCLKQYERSIASYDKAIQIYQELGLDQATLLSQMLINRGNALKSIGRLEESIKNYNQALAIEPNSDQALVQCGDALNQLGL
ncbi:MULTISPECIES: tetratricopeptide repeat protein [unclassified Moorena]|uniref:tetratricopeptide repeat protein n=1 Tax=unclassified Moorena TaxID=2683338 RepID=UPI0013BA3F7F|nr:MULTISPECIES: tetratricopeptide repeat protein [unclassified Moorena]NER90014.1 tetratricopeptide repeat protein [Moorena sp. SIO3A2]NES41436.1 tetratricopeptide repeat protein [Moorena sp. SIO2C4]